MTNPQPRLSDLTICNLCIPTPAGPVPGPSPIMPPCAPTVLVGCLPAARVGDMHIGIGPHPIALGSFTVMIQKMPAARIGDIHGCGGAITVGLPTVLTGG